MRRIDTATRAVNLFGAGKDGFKDGNLGLGIAPTDFNAAWPNELQEEIANVIEANGTALIPGTRTQLRDALRGRLIARRVFTATQVYTPTPGTTFVDVLVQGGGGGGWAWKRITAGFAGVTITVGAAGNGGVIAAGQAGGTSSFGALVTGPGGDGGSLGNVNANSSTLPNGFANSGIGTGGDYNGQGGYGGFALYSTNPVSGKGGDSYFGEGGIWRTGYATGGNALVFGAGGGGGNTPASNGGSTGGQGGQGVVIVEEYA